MYELINDVPLKIKEYKGQRVVTFKDIDTVHNRPEGTAKRNFHINRKHFVEGEDYFKVCRDEIRTNKIMDISPKTHHDIILVTESGYLMIVKSFTDDLSWNVQRQLVKTYFRVQEINNSCTELIDIIRKSLNADMENTVNTAVEKAISETVKVLSPFLTLPPVEKDTVKTIEKKYKYSSSKIFRLSPEIREQVDNMIISGNYSCQKIADFIEKNTGMTISYMTVSRYMKKYFIHK
ncbi:MAG: ORF6N domain-containing protein [Ruminococcus sp.]|nr:ORF6N domain-containing protein [Ruminococcus sp.]